MTRPVLHPTVSAENPGDLIRRLSQALAGTGPALALGSAPDVVAAQVHVPDSVALMVSTSGSTAQPQRVLLDAQALTASAQATHERLGGPGQWLLTLPPTHVAGIQVLVRSIIAGTDPVFAELGPFSAASFVADVARMTPGSRRYVSLVPTQLHRLLADDTTAGHSARHALRTFDGILVGGAVLSPDLAQRANAAHLQVRATYGMTETCGGCVYDGVPLTGVQVRSDETGRLQIAGPMLMRGYQGDAAATEAAFVTDGGVRWLRTNDLGTVTSSNAVPPSDGAPSPTESDPNRHGGHEGHGASVTVTGRADDVIICGGVNVQAAAVESALAGWSGIGEACVVPKADPEWGHVPIAVITAAPNHIAAQPTVPSLSEVQARVRDLLGSAAAPRELHIVTEIPTRGPGKYDRRQVQALVAGDPEANAT